MAFKLANRPTPVLREFLMKNSEAAVYGECLSFDGTTGRLTKTAAAGTPAVVSTHAVDAGTNKKVKAIVIDPTQEWEADYVGTPDGAFVLGQTAADLDSTGANLNAADITGGPCSVLAIDSVNKKAIVQFKARALN